jgi:drug/metabolite transporter (DMT)-like permease
MLIFKGKIRSSGVSPSHFMLVRCIIAFVMSALGLYIFKKPVWPESLKDNNRNEYIFWARHLFGNSAYFLVILTMSMLPLGITMILFNTAPFWSVLFGKFINGETINLTQGLLMIGSFTGVVLVAISKLVAKPATETTESDTPIESIEDSGSTYLVGVICGIFAAFCFSLLGVMTRKL